jgi:hypothetical protein
MLAISFFFSGDMAAKPRRRWAGAVEEGDSVVVVVVLMSCMVEAPGEEAAMLRHCSTVSL